MNDYITSIEQFYASIKIFFHVANKTNMDILPELSELSPTDTLRLIILPSPLYAEYGHAKVCYDSIGHVLKYIIYKNELTKKAPLAGEMLLYYIGGNKEGWGILHELFKTRLPCPGVTDFDVKATINSLMGTGTYIRHFFDELH